MADDVTLDPGTGGAVIATDEDGSQRHVQVVKLAVSADGESTHLNADNTNGLDVDVTRVSGTVTVDGSGVTQPVSAASLPLPTGAATSANQSTVIGHLDGVEGLLTTIDADTGGILTAVQTLDDAISGTEMQVDVVAALPTGDNNIGNVDIASAIPAGTNNIGDVDIASIAAGDNNIGNVDIASIAAGTNAIGDVGIEPRTSGGLSKFRSIDLDETEEAVKTAAGQLFGWYIYNDGAAEVYVHIYDALIANVTVGTTTPDMTIPIPAGAAANVFSDIGIAFATAISAAATTTVAGADAPAANQVIANLFYA